MAKKRNSRKKAKTKMARGGPGSIILLILILAFTVVTWVLVFKSNVLPGTDAREAYLHIPRNADYNDVIEILQKENLIKNIKTFEWMADRFHYAEHVHPGRYLIRKGMGNFELVRLLRSGKEVPVRLVINNIETKEELAGLVGRKLEPDSAEILGKILDKDFLKKYGVTGENVLCLFIPDTYEFYWNATADDFLTKMMKEYDRFWTEKRLKRAAIKGLTPVEVSILASIVQKETNKSSEYRKIAGVYLNRLRIGMRLQADPTIQFLVRDRKVRRVYNNDLEIESPYNTYKRAGLPPGPICLPKERVIDAVLDADEHNYFYFCAKADLSGYHVFSRNYDQHLYYRNLYRKALNEKNIR